jgi:hypothetical protein
MLQNISRKKLAEILIERQACAPNEISADSRAEWIIESTHPLLEHIVEIYMNGTALSDIPDFEYKDYSIKKIQEIRKPCGLFTAVSLLSEYIVNQESGEKNILEKPFRLSHKPLDTNSV